MISALAWGATVEERRAALPCDGLLATARCRWDRAVDVDAPVALIYRWLCQLKLAPYSYDLLDNFGRRSPRELVAGTERLETGQRFMSIFSLASYTPDQHLTLRSRHAAVTYSVRDGPVASRLAVRVRFDPPGGRVGAVTLGLALAVGDLLMMRKQLLTLRGLAERDARAGSADHVSRAQ